MGENGTCECDIREFQMSDEEFEELLQEMDEWVKETFPMVQ